MRTTRALLLPSSAIAAALRSLTRISRFRRASWALMSSSMSTSSLGTIAAPCGSWAKISRRPPRFANRMPVPKPRSANVKVEMRLDAGGRGAMLTEGATLWTGAICGAGATRGDGTVPGDGTMLCVVAGAAIRGAGGVSGRLWAYALLAACVNPNASKTERTEREELSKSNRVDIAIIRRSQRTWPRQHSPILFAPRRQARRAPHSDASAPRRRGRVGLGTHRAEYLRPSL